QMRGERASCAEGRIDQPAIIIIGIILGVVAVFRIDSDSVDVSEHRHEAGSKTGQDDTRRENELHQSPPILGYAERVLTVERETDANLAARRHCRRRLENIQM